MACKDLREKPSRIDLSQEQSNQLCTGFPPNHTFVLGGKVLFLNTSVTLFDPTPKCLHKAP